MSVSDTCSIRPLATCMQSVINAYVTMVGERCEHASCLGVGGGSGPVITLSGETDVTTVAELSELVTGQLAGGTRHLTIDAPGLSFADSASIRC